ncbi:MAG: serine/threonine-protein kinase [Kofleriaceae bacterium]
MSLDHLDTLPAGKTTPGEDDLIAFGGRVGRYLILDRVGRGGMGVVYAAYDSVLDRRIAVKIMRAQDGEDASSGRVRMEREAQALARLSHENIVTVHDVGEHAGSMYIAMELVEGATLREWQKDKPWREILRAYLDAARGLSAAHAAGLVHRDFKPENVLVDAKGDVRVTDFGLARRAGDGGPAVKHLSPSAFDSDLTAAGTVMGTVAYMAIEQIEGRSVDERTDQYSWCIATWEGLFGEQPFVSGNLEARREAMTSTVPKPPAKPALPRGIVRVLQRGLAADPKERWPSVEVMVAEIERAMSSRRWYIAAGGFASVAIVAGVFAIGHSSGARAANACANVASDPVWTPQMKATIEKAFSATNVPYAPDASRLAAKSIEAWQERWHGIALDSCVATRTQHTQSEQMLDLRTACLAKRRDELATIVGGLAHADPKVVEHAATLALPDLDACNDPQALAGVALPPLPDPAQRELETKLAAIELELAGALTLPRAKELLDQLPDASKVTYPPLVARIAIDRAKLEEELGHGKKARGALLEAAAAASAAGDNDLLVDAYLRASQIEARVTSEFNLGKSWLGLAKGTMTRMGSRPKKLLAWDHAAGDLAYREGRMDDARDAFRQELAQATALDPGGVLEIRALSDLGKTESELNSLADAHLHLDRARVLAKQQLGEAHPLVGGIYHDLGTVVFREGKFTESLLYFETAAKIRSAAYGADSVEAANSIQAVGNALVSMDRPQEAAQKFGEAIAIFTARLGPDHPDVANAYNDIGGTYHRAGDYEKALANAQHVKAIREKVLGPDHPDVAESLVNEAIEAKNLGRWDIVNANYPRAFAIYEAKSKDSLEVGITSINYGEALRAQGKLDEAEKAYNRARDIIAKQLGEDHPILGHTWNGLGQVELARGHRDEAQRLLERAVQIRGKANMDATDLAESKFALARALPETDAARAKQLAQDAAAVYKDSGPGYAKRYAEVEAWLTGR